MALGLTVAGPRAMCCGRRARRGTSEHLSLLCDARDGTGLRGCEAAVTDDMTGWHRAQDTWSSATTVIVSIAVTKHHLTAQAPPGLDKILTSTDMPPRPGLQHGNSLAIETVSQLFQVF